VDFSPYLFDFGTAGQSSVEVANSFLPSVSFSDNQNSVADLKTPRLNLADQRLANDDMGKVVVTDTAGGGKRLVFENIAEGDLTPQADGTFKGVLTTKEDGEKSAVIYKTDGTLEFPDLDGDRITMKINQNNGLIESITLEGQYGTLTRNSDNTSVWTDKLKPSRSYSSTKNADGTEENRKYPDGSTELITPVLSVRTHLDGNIERTYPNGQTEVYDAKKQTSTTRTPDGRTIVVDERTNTSTETSADNKTKSTTYFDQLGKVKLVVEIVTDPSDDTRRLTKTYDNGGITYQDSFTGKAWRETKDGKIEIYKKGILESMLPPKF